MLAIDAEIGRFRIRRLLGAGSMGEVYVALDLQLGRLVALKVIQPRLRHVRGFERFLKEAQTTASLSHPNIVTIYDVGNVGGSVYLALEYLHGESLAERLRGGPLSIDEALRVGHAVASATAYAHTTRVLHGDLKPANIMLPPDGRPRVVDFGLASELDAPSVAGVAGTPMYMAPEQWQPGPRGDRVDVWALGLILYECLMGRHPFEHLRTAEALRTGVTDPQMRPGPLTRAGLQPEIVALVGAMMDVDPARRPTADRCQAVLDAALSPGAGIGAAETPFVGLRTLEERHSALFRGRDDELEMALERLRSACVLTVVGPSGVGKSSFVHAGLVPRLRAQRPWTVIALRPGRAPMRALATQLRAAGAGAADGNEDVLVHQLRHDPRRLALELSLCAGRGHALLVIDQLEELFTHVADEGERSAFLSAIFRAAEDPAEPVRVVITARDDFIGRLPSLRDVLVLAPPSRAQLIDIVRRPVQQVGYTFEDPDMPTRIVEELEGAAGDLPLLQFACRQLWDARDETRKILLSGVFHRIGGVAGALAAHGETTLAAMSASDVVLARKLLLGLVTAEGTRRVRDRSSLIAELGANSEAVLSRMVDARLLVLRRAVEDDTTTVELAHEALIARWARLASWVDSAREVTRLRAELEAAAALWTSRGSPPDEAWTGSALTAALHRSRDLGLVLTGNVATFLEAGAARERRQRRRRVVILASLIAFLAASAVGAALIAHDYQARERVARQQHQELIAAGSNRGWARLELELFDWDEESLTSRPAPTAEHPELEVHLYAPKDGSPDEPGLPVDADLVSVRTASSASSSVRAFELEAPGMRAFLKISGRGRAQESCPPAWVRVAALPGYAERRKGVRSVLRVPVPTCQASRAGTIDIEPGPFRMGGPGTPPIYQPEHVQPEARRELGRYRIDRTELTNAAFAPFARIQSLTELALPSYPSAELPHIEDLDHPVAGIDAQTAAAVCLFWGKRLPTWEQWVKAARGGLTVYGQPNREPGRAVPWGSARTASPNLLGEPGSCDTTSSVRIDRGTASPYGVVDLVGNVAEWLAAEDLGPRQPLQAVAGGGWNTRADDAIHTTVSANWINPRFVNYQTGVRCVTVEEGER